MDCPDAIMGQEESSSKDICSEDEDRDKIELRTVALPGDLISKFLDQSLLIKASWHRAMGAALPKLRANELRIELLVEF